MVNKEQFEEICNKYGLDSKRLIKNNENIIKKANYADICYVLDYLIGTLKIFPSNIEKCPSILYLNVEAIKGNVFYRPAKEIDDIVKVCKANEIKITGSIFQRNAKQLKESKVSGR